MFFFPFLQTKQTGFHCSHGLKKCVSEEKRNILLDLVVSIALSAFPAFGDFTEYACLLRNISCTTSVENYSLDKQFVYSQDSRRKTSLTSMCFADHLLVTLDSSQTFSVLNIFMLIVFFMHDNVHRRVIVN